MISRCFRQVLQFVRSWWNRDRIRVSPNEGRLLRISPGDLLVVGELQAEVLARSLVQETDSLRLCLSCRTQFGPAELQITATPDGKPAGIVWTERNCCQTLTEDSLEIWPRSNRR